MKETLRQHLGQSCSTQEIKQWFDPLGITADEHHKRLMVTFPHALFAEWFSSNMRARFEEQVSRVLGPGYVLDYVFPSGNEARGGIPVGPKQTMTGLPYGHAFTFQSFLAGKANQFPFDLAREVVDKQDATYNPLVFFGVSGCGKSHLLKAMGNELNKTHGQDRILLGTVEDIRHIYAKHGGDYHAARQECCAHDFLLLDDFHVLEEYENLHEELIAVFDHYSNHRKQMAFCISPDIHALDGLHPKMRARLNAGLMVNLKEPDLDILVRFINRMCRNKKISLTKSQVLILAQRFRDFRSLQGILLKLFAFKNLVQPEITEKAFHKIIDPTSDTRDITPVTPERVMDVVAREFNIQPRDILGLDRTRNVVQARQTAMYLCRELMSSSYPQLGRIFGGKDHSTVMHSIKKIDKMQADNKEMKTMLTRLKKTCLSLDGR